MKINKLSISKKILVICIYASIFSTVQADDTDMIIGDQVEDTNILFLLDMSRSMLFELDSDDIAGANTVSRMDTLQNAFSSVIGNKNLANVNIGVTTFGRDSVGTFAGGVTYPVSPIDDSSISALGINAESYMPVPQPSQTTRQYLSSQNFLDTLVPDGGTPLVDGLYESYLYFKGLNVDYGDLPASNKVSAHPSTYTGTPKKYKSPVTACSSNAIVLVTDGFPSVNNSATKVQTIIGGAEDCASDTDVLPATGGYTAEGRCGIEFANYLGTHSITGTESDEQYLKIYTIGLAIGGTSQVQIETQGYLDDIATNSGGESFLAGNEEELVGSLTDILKSIPQARTFTSPSFTPDLTSMLTHDQYTYMAMFDQESGPSWFGNLKKFKVIDQQVVDRTGALAFNSDGTLKSSAKDFWSVGSSSEEHPVKSGGTAQLLVDTSTRNLYTDILGGDLTTSSNGLLSSNLFITKTLLGDPAMSSAHRDELISYIRGNEKRPPDSLPGVVLPRKHMGDILHSKPVILNYGQEKVIYVGTNEGYLHAFRDDTGQELYAYMPSELLANIETQYTKDQNVSHVYGVDGPITVRHDDNVIRNGIVDTGEKAILYFGLRRGGHAYYAIDVSVKAKPKLLWKINNNDNDFSNLGFTWSQPTLSRMSYTKNGVEKKNQSVLVFGGGYIDDNANEPEENTIASDVYIVNADTGELIWKTPTSTIFHAVPGKVNVIDMDSDGSIDRLYFADVGGFIWRVDFVNYNFDQVIQQRIHKFADLAGTGLSKRKFFVEPDIALFQRQGKFYISLAIGSGERPDPLKEDSDNHFFVLFDKDISLTSTPTTITMNDLVDVTSTTATNILSGSKKGWYLDLEEITGEKVFSKSLTYRNKVMFNTVGIKTSTQSSLNADNSCDAKSQTPSVFYALDLFTAGSVLKIGAGGTMSRSSPSYGSGNIPGTPQIYYSDFHSSTGGACTKTDCGRDEGINVQNQIISIGSTTQLNQVYWRDKGR